MKHTPWLLFIWAPIGGVACGAEADRPNQTTGEQRDDEGHGEGKEDEPREEVEPPAACTPASSCAGCGACHDLCRCAGGSSAECDAECTATKAPPPSEPPPVIEEPDGTTVVTLVTDEFEIPPGGETFRCQQFSNPFGRDVAVIESESHMPSGSHHMFVFQGSYPSSALVTCGGLEFGPSVHSSQRPDEILTYPEGVGRHLPATDGLRVQAHYLNTTAEPITAYVATTLRVVEIDAVDELASHLFINTLNVSVPPRSSGQAATSCSIPHDARLLSATSHMHQFGVYFEARDATGQLIYTTNQWAEPEPWSFDPALLLRAGSRIDVRCEYENPTDATLTFGESAATNEMCILSGFYYPAPDGAGITCLF